MSPWKRAACLRRRCLRTPRFCGVLLLSASTKIVSNRLSILWHGTWKCYSDMHSKFHFRWWRSTTSELKDNIPFLVIWRDWHGEFCSTYSSKVDYLNHYSSLMLDIIHLLSPDKMGHRANQAQVDILCCSYRNMPVTWFDNCCSILSV
jgi:hypothetical protein